MEELPNGAWARSHRYVRIAMVALLVGIGIAVIYQTGRQEWHLLASVSAYYYTPAQGIFVGALIGLAACMIALRGTTDVEDVLLNVGGMFTAVVAVVPTARDKDYQTAVRLCGVAIDKLPDGLDCPSIHALAAVTRANVENIMIVLLVLGVLGLITTGLLLTREHNLAQPKRVALSGLLVATVVYLVAAVAYFRSIEWFIDHAHYLAAVGLFGCIVAVVFVNARRHERERQPKGETVKVPRNRYSAIALVMIGVTLIGVALWLADVITLFWLEIAVAGLFAVFWAVQTVEQMPAEEALSETHESAMLG